MSTTKTERLAEQVAETILRNNYHLILSGLEQELSNLANIGMYRQSAAHAYNAIAGWTNQFLFGDEPVLGYRDEQGNYLNQHDHDQRYGEEPPYAQYQSDEPVPGPDPTGERARDNRHADIDRLYNALLVARDAITPFEIEEHPEVIHDPIEAHMIGEHLDLVLAECVAIVDELIRRRRFLAGEAESYNRTVLELGVLDTWDPDSGGDDSLQKRANIAALKNVEAYLTHHGRFERSGG